MRNYQKWTLKAAAAKIVLLKLIIKIRRFKKFKMMLAMIMIMIMTAIQKIMLLKT